MFTPNAQCYAPLPLPLPLQCVLPVIYRHQRERTSHHTYLLSSSGCRRRRIRGCLSRASIAASRRSSSVTTSRRRGLCSLSATRFSNRKTAASCGRTDNTFTVRTLAASRPNALSTWPAGPRTHARDKCRLIAILN